MRFGGLVILLCLLGTIFNAALIRSFSPNAITPDFALILTVAIALYHYTPLGVLAAFFLGLLADFSSAQFIGPNAAGCVLAFFTVGLIANRMYAEKWIAVMIITLGCSMVKSATYFGFLSLYFPTYAGENLEHMLLGESFLTALVSPFIIRFLRKGAFRTSPFGKAAQTGSSSTATSSGRWSPSTRLHWT